MALLGVPYRLVYESKFFVSGLTNILAMVLKPNGTVVGPFNLLELTSLPGYSGVYSYNFNSNANTDPEGEYLAVIISPTDQVRDFHRFTLQQASISGNVTQYYGVPVAVNVVTNQIDVRVEPQAEIAVNTEVDEFNVFIAPPMENTVDIIQQIVNVNSNCNED